MTLGCEDYRLSLYRKGGNVKLADFPRFTSLTYGRHLDETVTTTLVVPTGDCCDVLAQAGSWGTEIVVHRGDDRVWEGPITRRAVDAASATITAKDVSAWLSRRVIRERFPGRGRVVSVAAEAVRRALIHDDPNILRYLDTVCADNSVHVKAKAPRYSQKWLDYLTTLDGLDWTVLLRRIILMPQGAPLGYGPDLTQDDFAGLLQVVEDGEALATHLFGTNGTKLLAERSLSQPFFGVHEDILDVSQSDIDEIDTGALLTSTLQATYPVPMTIAVPSGASFTPQSHVAFNDLIPGVLFDVRADGCLPLEQKLRLLTMDVTVDSAGEHIAVTFANPTEMPDCRPIRVSPGPTPPPDPFPVTVTSEDGSEGVSIADLFDPCDMLVVTGFVYGSGAHVDVKVNGVWHTITEWSSAGASYVVESQVRIWTYRVPLGGTATDVRIVLEGASTSAAAEVRRIAASHNLDGHQVAFGGGWLIQMGGGTKSWTAAGDGIATFFVTAAWNLGNDFFVPVLGPATTVIIGSSNPITVTYGPDDFVSGFVVGLKEGTC